MQTTLRSILSPKLPSTSCLGSVYLALESQKGINVLKAWQVSMAKLTEIQVNHLWLRCTASSQRHKVVHALTDELDCVCRVRIDWKFATLCKPGETMGDMPFALYGPDMYQVL